jgi:cell fate (sporulation/competence/biofilm development) regulator YlbF (YheA/YmcA/DUF963 family)
MSDKQNLTNKIISAWRGHVQEYLNDPKTAQIIIENYAKFQETFDEFIKQASNSTSESDDDDDDNELHELKASVNELESRIRILEKIVASNLPKTP